MPRKGPAPKRPVIVDPVYSSPLVTSLVNKVLTDGKRSVAERIVYLPEPITVRQPVVATQRSMVEFLRTAREGAATIDVSMAMGELALLPAVRKASAGDLIVADGTSCRHQIKDGAGREALHVARVLAMALSDDKPLN